MKVNYQISVQQAAIRQAGKLNFEVAEEEDAALSFGIVSENSFWLTAMLYDSNQRLRGQFVANGQSATQFITRNPATTSYSCVAGDIPKGTWYLDYQLVAQGDDAVITLEVETLATIIRIEPHNNHNWYDFNGTKPFKDYYQKLETEFQGKDARWYKGDFHTHTIASDGKMTMSDNQQSALQQKLDFYVATDHNVVPTQWAPAAPVVFPGVEVTSTLGHFNLLWVEDLVFDSISINDIENSQTLLKLIESYRKKALISINHPFLTVWKWLLHDLPLAWVDSIELMNDPTYGANQVATHQAMKFWDALLNDGHQITGIGGSDSHLKPEDHYPGSVLPSLIGDPATLVYADSLSPNSLKKAIKAGRVLVTRLGELEVSYNGFLPGERRPYAELLADPSIEVKVSYQAESSLNYLIEPTIQVILDGKILEKQQASSLDSTYRIDQVSEAHYHWLRVQLINHDHEVLAISNPIYYGNKTPTYQTWADALQEVPDTTSND